VDRLRDTLVPAARRQHDDPLAFLKNRDVFGDLIDNERFVSTYRSVLSSLHNKGARATLEDLAAS
jgi:mannitol 2-dehydrogenase